MVQQLFKISPPIELVEEILSFFGIINFNESYKFTREDIVNKYVIQKMLKMPFEKFYINCKYQKYFTDMDEKKCITVLRQLLKVHCYRVLSIEKFSTGKKYLTYHIAKIVDPASNHPDEVLAFD